jgi:hypothetical protein
MSVSITFCIIVLGQANPGPVSACICMNLYENNLCVFDPGPAYTDSSAEIAASQ